METSRPQILPIANTASPDRRRRHQSRQRALRKGRHSRPNDLVQRLPLPRQQRRTHLQRPRLASHDKRSHLPPLLRPHHPIARNRHVNQQISRIPHHRRPHHKSSDRLHRPHGTTLRHRSCQEGRVHLPQREMLLLPTGLDSRPDALDRRTPRHLRRHRIRHRPTDRRFQPLHRPDTAGRASPLTTRNGNGALQENGPARHPCRLPRSLGGLGHSERLSQVPVQSRSS